MQIFRKSAIIAGHFGAAVKNFPFETESLRKWFLDNKRDLPWRNQEDPYAVWVSEIMLQQTQVAVVLEYFERWMMRFPTIQNLADAELDDVIKMWEGLGYYSRARHLHAAAQFLVANHGSKLPSTKEELIKVKGLGPYTVGAILSFAFKKRSAAVDGNVMRVLTRYFTMSVEIDLPKGIKAVWEAAEEILPEDKPWEIVEGLIELGAMVCKKEPRCIYCPLKKGCRAYKEGLQVQLPKKAKKIQITTLKRSVFVIEHDGYLLVRKGEKGKVMADLYEFPYVENEDENFPFSFKAIALKTLSQVNHSFTRFRVVLMPSIYKAIERLDVTGYEWVPKHKLVDYPFSSGHRKILHCLKDQIF